MKYLYITNSDGLNDIAIKVTPNTKTEMVLILMGEISGALNIDINLAKFSKSKILVGGSLSGNSNLHINYLCRQFGKESHSIFESFFCLNDNARKTSSLKINFENGSQNSSGIEKDSTMLLSDSARNICSPAIFCHEENVNGTHGMSTGHIDENVANYLKTRGVNESEIRALITRAHLSKLIDCVKDANIVSTIRRDLGYGRD